MSAPAAERYKGAVTFEEEITFLRAVRDAVVARDAASLASVYALPCLVVTRTGAHAYADATTLADAAQSLLDRHAAAGLSVTDAAIVATRSHGPGLHEVTIEWTLGGRDASRTRAVRASYTLLLRGGAWRVAAVITRDPE